MKLIFDKMLKIIHISEKLLRYETKYLRNVLYRPGDPYELDQTGVKGLSFYDLTTCFAFKDYKINFILRTPDFEHTPVNSFHVTITSQQITNMYSYMTRKPFEQLRLYSALELTLKDRLNDKTEYDKLIATLNSNILELI